MVAPGAAAVTPALVSGVVVLAVLRVVAAMAELRVPPVVTAH